MSPLTVRPMRSARRLALPLMLAICALAAIHPGLARASAGPAWFVKSATLPTGLYGTTFSSTEEPGFLVTVTNVGDAPSSGVVTINDTVPSGAEVVAVRHRLTRIYEPGSEASGEVGATGEAVSCEVASSQSARCSYNAPMPVGGVIEFFVSVTVTAGPGSKLTNHADVEGGGALPAETSEPGTAPTTIASGPASFGIESFSTNAFAPGGGLDLQAGSHPASVETTVTYNTVLDSQTFTAPYDAVLEPKTETVDLPMGFVGDALSTPRCSEATLSAGACPADTRIGVVGIYKSEPRAQLLYIYNVTPEAGYPAQFGFSFYETAVMLRPRVVPSQSGYVLSVSVPAVPRSQSIKVREVSTLFYGDPLLVDGGPIGEAFATNPSSCASGPLSARLEMNAWEAPSDWQTAEAPMFAASGSSQGVTGCERLQFDPSLQATPETSQVDTPSGYEIKMRVPQTPNFEGDLSTSDLKDAVVSLPAGVSVSPSAANGLEACQETGPEGIDLGNHDILGDENQVQEGEEMGPDELVHAAPGHCPEASRIGEAEVVSPLVEAPLKGSVFVAAPGCGGSGQAPCTAASAGDGELFGIFLEVAGSGVVVKLRGDAFVNPSTGQVTTSFKDAPELPFSELTLRLNGGQRAPLANPQSCGEFTLTSDLTPWSEPYTPDATPISQFGIGGCTGAFAPSFLAETKSASAGTFSPFTVTIGRHDGEGDLSGVSVTLPPGVIGITAGVTKCGEAEVHAAEAGTGGCPEASRLGTATAAAGAGSDPYWQSGGVYLTGAYAGAPFGLAIVVPANAGPYHLGNIVVRARIEINKETTQVTTISNPLPQMVDGVPLRVQTVNVALEREKFTFNATRCAGGQSITGTISSTGGANASESTSYGASGCASMPFAPSLSAFTRGRASKLDGEALTIRGSAKQGPFEPGGAEESNIRKLDLQLPGKLPSRNETLQKACTEAQFAANPAGCPAASDIGTMEVHTPVLTAPLVGPIYLVSHGGAAFPDTEVILQGEGVEIVLDGKTQIKKGITYSHFETVPDAPFSSFEVKLPEGRYSILGTNIPERLDYNLCGQSIKMPVSMEAQSGKTLSETVTVAVQGCKAAKAKAKAKKTTKGKKASHGRASSRGGRR
jgi:hypothetical protein